MSLSLPVFDNIASTTADIIWMQMEWVIATYLVRGQQPAILGKKPVINKVKNPLYINKVTKPALTILSGKTCYILIPNKS